jgi:hypothetical protein
MNNTFKYVKNNISYNYKTVCLNDIYFDLTNLNEYDKSSQINFIYNAFLKPDVLNGKTDTEKYPFNILKGIKYSLYENILQLLGAE